MLTPENILMIGFFTALAWACYLHVKYDAQVKLNDDLIGIIRKLTAQIEEYKKVDCQPGAPKEANNYKPHKIQKQ